MKKTLYFLVTLILFSCSTSSDVVSHNLLQKRKYNRGYFYKKYQNQKKSIHNSNYNDVININSLLSNSMLKEKTAINTANSPLTASRDANISKTDELNESIFKIKKINVSQKKVNKLVKKIHKKTQNHPILSQIISPCDILIMMDGSEISAKILEITPYEIKYKNCDNLEGPTFTKSLSTVFKIKYANGTSQMMNNTQDNYTDDNDFLGLGLTEGKSQEIALGLFAFCLIGVFGVYRMYLGYWGLGILHFLTAGFCFIGTIIDLVKILDGSLKPKGGEYKS